MFATAYSSLCWQWFLVLGEVHGLPLTLDNPRANLRGSLSLAQLLVSVEIFADANIASRAVFAGEAIQQAAVPLAAIAVAVAWLLVKRLLDSSSNGVGILHAWIGEEFRIHRRRECAGRNLIVKRGDSFIGPGLRHVLAFR